MCIFLYAVKGSDKEWLTTLTMQHYAGEDEEDQLAESEIGIRWTHTVTPYVSARRRLNEWSTE